MKKFIVPILLISLMLTSCSSLDVVQKDAARAIGEVLTELPAIQTEGGWRLTSPDGLAVLNFDQGGVQLVAVSAPFAAAGLDTEKLDNADENGIYFAQDFLMLGRGVSGDAGGDFAKMLAAGRDALNYHTALDHYGVKLGDGNMFEWAKDMNVSGYDNSVQDKDIVFVLNPEPLIAAGVDPEKVEGWVYAQVEVEENGKTAQVWKFLKPFDLVK
ncbi:MAG: hypothetical protein LBC78_05565 [Oscillospiraceae bacterium]|jgi:hypothetical protein|nr:hypothetical protein [Oscillospiraceae bacterium]